MSFSFPMLLPLLLLWCLALPGGHTFFPNFWSKVLSFTWGSYTHQDLTEEAVLNITLQILLEKKHPTRPPLRWEDFEGKTLTPDNILLAYYGNEVSLRQYRTSMRQIVSANANMDFLNGTRNDPIRHFDSERVRQGNSLLLRAREELLSYIKAKEYGGAREILGHILHALQDFYSHSNWVELGHTDIHPDLATPGKDITSLAGASDQTCTDCTDMSCQNNIVSSIQKRHLLTSGYYGETPEKPQGKCSHGGPFDYSKEFSAKGGINKDTATPLFSPHHFLHEQAAQLALKASIKFLTELRRDINDSNMLRLLGVSAFPALSFVLDTTGSMGEEITSARLQSRHIIQRQRDTLLQPDYYILVPFHDPGFGPVHKTSDPDEFLRILDSLQALGGGDEPEMCLSALQLALINTPPHSEILVFTDASSKDAHLRSSVEALIQEKKIKVSFLITEDPSRTTVKRSKREVLSPDRFDIYTDLASTSGGQVVFTTNNDIGKASEIITDSANFDVVTLFYKQSSTTGASTYIFLVDEFMHNITLFINGEVIGFHIYDPKGHQENGRRASHGKFTRVFLQDPLEVGNWSIKLETSGPHSIRIQGLSSLDFLYYFGTPVNGSHPGLHELNNQPMPGVPTVLVVDVIGLPESSNMSHVDLTPVNGKTRTLELEPTNKKGLLVAQVGEIPIGEFSLGVSGTDGRGHKVKREAPQHLRSAECMLEMSRPATLIPGNSQIMSMKITHHGSPCYYCVTVNLSPDNIIRDRPTSSRIQMNSSDSQELDININMADNVKPGTVITLMVKAEECENIMPVCFTHLSLVVEEMYFLHSPSVCLQPSYFGTCPESLLPNQCMDHRWSAHFLVSDADGIKSINILNGSGSASHGSDGEYEYVNFTSTCCTPQTELLLMNYRDVALNCSLQAPKASSQTNSRHRYYLIIILLSIMVVLVLGAYLLHRRRAET
ncbi:von Willebrand factor A domain-containing protein 7 [Pyxicephalus adspersus]|uniref:von Willebrand factor A domain-containing protein 7 n=1 Tax=Pyxicephalus adspersus TaxID=30357 RepID=UPI003B59CB24